MGADGAGSVVRRDLGIMYPKSKVAATLEAEAPVGRDVLDSFNRKNYYDFGLFRSGYGWAFPKSRAGTVNVGVVVSVEDVVRMGRPMTGMFWDFLRGLDLYKDQAVQPHGSILPYQGTVDTLGREGVLLLGDAAGFVEPLGGEGIPYAIESGINAARAVKEHLEDGKPLLDSYEELMKDLLEEINVYGIRIHDNFYVKKNMMKAYFKIVKNNREMSNMMADMMSRRMSYKEAMESLSPWRFFLAYIRTTLGL